SVCEIAIAWSIDHCFADPAIGSPPPETFLSPNRHLVPRFADAQASSSTAGREFEHHKCANHGTMFRFLNETIFDARFDIAQAVLVWPNSAGGKLEIVRRQDGRDGNDDVKMNVGKSSIKLNGRARRVRFNRRAVRRGERIKLVIPKVNRLRVVSLKR